MKLKEFEAKELFLNSQIPVSKGIIIKDSNELNKLTFPRMFKPQTLSGGRGKAGGIHLVESIKQAEELCKRFLKKEFLNETITEILFDEIIEHKAEFYLGVMFDTSRKVPTIIFCEEGGADIEELKRTHPQKIITTQINYLEGLESQKLKENIGAFLFKSSLDENTKQKVAQIFLNLYNCFLKYDCQMIEINPLALTQEGHLIAIDAVAVLDDNANYRREISFPERTGARKATEREIKARKIDQDDYRGVAGKTFLELDGDIAVLASGGGASITLMDALIKFGGKPANFTEYSGNPPKEKVEKLARIVLEKDNLSGLLIAGVIANFTDIAQTMEGIITVLREIKPQYPIVIRRAGPNDELAKKMLLKLKEELNLDLHYFNEELPLTKSAELIVKLSEEYKQKLNKNHKIK